ncbi:carbohydrate kinase family protein [Celerinatantimonas diazotrophica]|uniref:Sugar/nucleoside kinase (Ribokinase family) n=1 Tax=Celerinatantimonas diazotrophica TaxID=412034 RepID=A0A4R1J8A6_9GAMM|nr:carbohydrate kinase family protein [Celerinatantimonas diazotrophica]TCK46690.1 sugar/nucleoside kinase (ribokinase family) [Celerinatantimonas diazotrophica]CAG9295392.1 2-dehydro-3-deoxygluconokinase [Celerinatantimonas diazotrophica]
MSDKAQSNPLYIVGNVNIDLIMGPLDSWPQRGTEVLLPSNTWRVGGSAGNSALAAEALGIPYRLIANKSDDIFGDWLAGHFANSQSWPTTQQSTSVTVGITHNDHERTFLTGQGNVEQLSINDVLSQLPEQSHGHEIVLLSGAFLTLNLLSHYQQLIQTLKNRQFKIALDCGWPPQGWQAVRPMVQKWLPWVDFLLLNELEVLELSAQKNIERGAQLLHSWLPQLAHLVIKQGAQGASCYSNGQLYHCRTASVNVVDTVGAGDIFNTGYLASINESHSVDRALQWATTLASSAISTHPRHILSRSQLISDSKSGEKVYG